MLTIGHKENAIGILNSTTDKLAMAISATHTKPYHINHIFMKE